MSKTIMLVANGCEICEALITVDILKRANIEIDVVSITDNLEITASNDSKFIADKSINDLESYMNYDMLILPGGCPGVDNLYNCEQVQKIILDFNSAKKKIASICAAPSILAKLGILDGMQATVYPSFKDDLNKAILSTDDPVTCEHITTASGLGKAIDFALKLVEILQNEEASKLVASSIIYKMH